MQRIYQSECYRGVSRAWPRELTSGGTVNIPKEGTGFVTSIYRKPTFTGQYISWNSFSPKMRKISLIKTLVDRALMICSKTKWGSELDKIKQLLIENGCPTDVLLSCTNQKPTNFAAEKILVQRSVQ